MITKILDQLIYLDRIKKTTSINKKRLHLEMKVVLYHEERIKPVANVDSLKRYILQKKYLSLEEAVVVEGKENLIINANSLNQ
ncbi:hypothetical protein Phi39:1_gp07 [Cellulophaga phage phi39:1]|uniref:hypothetical protein n=1 Tax=Cellulophaga phage phi39:1 TaxID=1327993 RepID=UPI000351C3A6|nr:hypothetical protein Phi39:1_gp07 [Cellulophaga phage phi39:1]AGO49122.1 hypothetical protein Phi39:1_gp07 [Cellulophaga phage phi39:1]